MSIVWGEKMIEKCFIFLVILSIVFGIATGNIENVANAALDGAAKAIGVVISLAGAMCLWNGVMAVFKESGAIGALSKLLRPLFAKIFPETWKSGNGSEEICAALCANILGIGNAATPLALAAMKKMHEASPDKKIATDDMVTFAALGAASIDILPTTIITLRRTAGSSDPYSVIIPIWICSFCLALLTVLLCRIIAAVSRKRRIER